MEKIIHYNFFLWTSAAYKKQTLERICLCGRASIRIHLHEIEMKMCSRYFSTISGNIVENDKKPKKLNWSADDAFAMLYALTFPYSNAIYTYTA